MTRLANQPNLGRLFGAWTNFWQPRPAVKKDYLSRYDVVDHGVQLPDVAEFPELLSIPRFPAGTEIERDLQDKFRQALRDCEVDTFVATLGELEQTIVARAEITEHPNEIEILKRQLQNTFSIGKWYIKYKQDWAKFDRSDIASNDAYLALQEDGVCSRSIDTDAINGLLRQEIESLCDQQVADICRPGEGYDRSKTFLNDGEHDELFSLLRGELKAQGMLTAAAKYHNCGDLDFKHACLHVCTPEDTHFTQTLQDCETTSSLIGLHIDPKPVMKVIVYLNEVNEASGPFSFVCGSHRWQFDELELLFAKGNSTGNYLHSPQHRWVAAQFPPSFRKNSIIGRFILDGTPQSQKLLAAERTFTSQTGNTMLFDPGNGLHRGGICQSGRRINLQIVLKAI